MTPEEIQSIIANAIEQAQDQEAAARFAADPHAPMITGLLHDFISSINPQLPNAIQTEEVNVFGLANNRLEPVDFNRRATFSKSGDVCVPRYCVGTGGFQVCFPPVDICASGIAHATLDRLFGLSTLQITNIDVTNFSVNGNVLTATGKMTAMVIALSAGGHISASGGPPGISIPVDASVSVVSWFPVAKGTATMTFNLDQQKLTAMTLDALKISQGRVEVHIKGLGAFSSIVDKLIEAIQSFIAPAINDDGVSDKLKDVLQKQINLYVNSRGTAAGAGR